MEGLIDTHAHLFDETFKDDLDQVLISAQNAGVEKIIIPAVDLESSRIAVALTEKYPQLYAAIGVHPEACDLFSPRVLSALMELAQERKVVAIGEIGLDFHYPPYDKILQERVLGEMLGLAARVNKPILVHSRDAMNEILMILGVWSKRLEVQGRKNLASYPGILHAFEGNLDQANNAVSLNYAIGLGGPITYRNASSEHSIAVKIGLNHMVLETDSPYLPPHPYRGQRNEPAYLLQIAQKLAELKNRPVEEIAHETGLTAKRILKMDD